MKDEKVSRRYRPTRRPSSTPKNRVRTPAPSAVGKSNSPTSPSTKTTGRVQVTKATTLNLKRRTLARKAEMSRTPEPAEPGSSESSDRPRVPHYGHRTRAKRQPPYRHRCRTSPRLCRPPRRRFKEGHRRRSAYLLRCRQRPSWSRQSKQDCSADQRPRQRQGQGCALGTAAISTSGLKVGGNDPVRITGTPVNDPSPLPAERGVASSHLDSGVGGTLTRFFFGSGSSSPSDRGLANFPEPL